MLWKVLLPLPAPGIAAGALLAFTLSGDDFLIAFFVVGPGAATLPIQVYSMIKHGSPPHDQCAFYYLAHPDPDSSMVQPTPDGEEVIMKQLWRLGYDVVVPTSYMVSIMHAEKMLQPIDHPKYIRIWDEIKAAE